MKRILNKVVKRPETELGKAKSCAGKSLDALWDCTFGKTGQGLCYYGEIKTFRVVVVVRASSDAILIIIILFETK